jgi:hypothetical protein
LLLARGARERITGIGAQAAHQVIARIRLHQPQRGAALVRVPRAQLAALRINLPHQQTLAGDEPVRALPPPVLQQQVTIGASALVETEDLRAGPDGCDAQRGVVPDPRDAHPAQLLLGPGVQVRGREAGGVTARAHQPPGANALR